MYFFLCCKKKNQWKKVIPLKIKMRYQLMIKLKKNRINYSNPKLSCKKHAKEKV